MSQYGDMNRHSSDVLPWITRRNLLNDRQPLSPISAQQQAIVEAKRGCTQSLHSKPSPSYAGILPVISNPDSLRRDNDVQNDPFSDTRSLSSSSVAASSFCRASQSSALTTPTFNETAHLDSSVSDWIDQNRQHFPLSQHGQAGYIRSNSVGPLRRPYHGGVLPQSLQSASTAGASTWDAPLSIHGGAFPNENGYAESIAGSTIDAASQLRQRRGFASTAIDNDDAASVYTVSSMAPAWAPSVAPSIAPSAASTASYHNASKNVDEVEMMDLDGSLTNKNQTNDSQLSSCLSNSDISSDDDIEPFVEKKPTSLPLRPNSSLPPIDPFLHRESGFLTKLISAFFRFLSLLVSGLVRTALYIVCLLIFLLTISFLLYACVYLWTHHRAVLSGDSFATDDSPTIPFDNIREAFQSQLFGQSTAGKRIVDALESFVESEDERLLLLSLHGSTGVGKSHAVNLLKRQLPAGVVHILYPDLIVHDLENHDDAASTARTTHFRNWISTRLLRSRDAAFKMIVVENADAHPELVDDIAVAIKDAVDVHDANVRETLEMRKANGLTDSLDEWIDWVFGIPKVLGADELLRRRKMLFVVVSNVGFRHVNALTYQATRDFSSGHINVGQGGQVVSVASVADEKINTLLLEKESPFFSAMQKTRMRQEVVAFLPLQAGALRQCLLANKEFLDAAAGSSVEDLIRTVLEKAEFFPRNDPTFSVSGCKRIASLLIS